MLHVLALGFFLQSQPFDILIQHARIVDGSGNPWYNGDIAIRGDNIAAIGRLDGASAKLTIDARGLTAAPGLIDIHTHARRGVFEDPSAQNYMIEGNDGSSPLSIAPFFQNRGEIRMAPNFGLFVGQGSIRQQVPWLEKLSNLLWAQILGILHVHLHPAAACLPRHLHFHVHLPLESSPVSCSSCIGQFSTKWTENVTI